MNQKTADSKGNLKKTALYVGIFAVLLWVIRRLMAKK